MASRPGTRGLVTRSNQAVRLKEQNENTRSLGVVGKMTRPVLNNATNKSQGLKRKAEDPTEGSKVVKAVKKRSAFGDITNVSVLPREIWVSLFISVQYSTFWYLV